MIFGAARVGDKICHSPGIDGFWKGSFICATLAVGAGLFVIGTGGLGLAALAATGAVAGGFGGEFLAVNTMDGIETGALTQLPQLGQGGSMISDTYGHGSALHGDARWDLHALG